MGRPPGSRNNDYHIKRQRLTERCTNAMVRKAGKRVSLRDLASAANVSVSTMRHYFSDRDGIVEAVFQTIRGRMQPVVDQVKASEEAEPAVVLRNFLDVFTTAWHDHNLGRMHAVGMAEGLHNQALGPKYVNALVDPMIGAVTDLLEHLEETGAFYTSDVRTAAAAFTAPIFLVLVHQDTFLGREAAAVNRESFYDRHIESFLSGWGVPQPAEV